MCPIIRESAAAASAAAQNAVFDKLPRLRKAACHARLRRQSRRRRRPRAYVSVLCALMCGAQVHIPVCCYSATRQSCTGM